MTRNIRFWALSATGALVKITLRPYQSLEHSFYSRHDEGWSRRSERWTHDSDRVLCEWEDAGVCCDGYIANSGHGYSDGSTRPYFVGFDLRNQPIYDDSIQLLNFNSDREFEVYDQFARMAGY